jgi:hypothetical protein
MFAPPVSDKISWQEILSLTEREKVVTREEKMRLPPRQTNRFDFSAGLLPRSPLYFLLSSRLNHCPYNALGLARKECRSPPPKDSAAGGRTATGRGRANRAGRRSIRRLSQTSAKLLPGRWPLRILCHSWRHSQVDQGDGLQNRYPWVRIPLPPSAQAPRPVPGSPRADLRDEVLE